MRKPIVTPVRAVRPAPEITRAYQLADQMDARGNVAGANAIRKQARAMQGYDYQNGKEVRVSRRR